MRKAKVITALALTVVMLVVMAGLAAAESLKVLDPATGAEVSVIELAPGSSVTYDLKVGPFLNNAPPNVTHWLDNYTFVNSPIGQESDITVEYQEQSPMRPWGPALYVWTQETASGTYETLKIKITLEPTAPIGANYTIAIMDVGTGGSIDIGVASVGISSVPEFTTIAIPVAAILGLFFFYSHRKRKEE